MDLGEVILSSSPYWKSMTIDAICEDSPVATMLSSFRRYPFFLSLSIYDNWYLLLHHRQSFFIQNYVSSHVTLHNSLPKTVLQRTLARTGLQRILNTETSSKTIANEIKTPFEALLQIFSHIFGSNQPVLMQFFCLFKAYNVVNFVFWEGRKKELKIANTEFRSNTSPIPADVVNSHS